MARFLPSISWLLGAALFIAGTLLVVQAFQAGREVGSVIIPINLPFNETTKAKQAPSDDMRADDVRAALPPLPRPALVGPQPGQLVEVAHYTSVARAHPSASSHVFAGYPVGQPFRVIARDGEFARVQDLGSGQLGWIRARSLTAYRGGYRPRQAPAVPRVAKPPRATVVAQVTAPETKAPPPQKQAAPAIRRGPLALGPAPEAEAPETTRVAHGRGRPVRAARDDSFVYIMQRAFQGAH